MIPRRFGHSGPAPLRCYKMHGLGNDYIYVLEGDLPPSVDMSALAMEVSDRHRGIGSDGLVLVGAGENTDFTMRIWNADGSEAQMCGNASRCVALLVRLLALTAKTDITLRTKSGVKSLHLNLDDKGRVASVTVDMGVPELSAEAIPVNPAVIAGDPSTFRAETPAGLLEFVPVGMGNPHGVTFLPETPDDSVVHVCGPFMERHEAWPEKANIEFARVMDRSNISMRVWERGSGETMACGTGACATAVAAILTGRADRKVTIHLPGGALSIEWRCSDSHVLMTGPASFVAEIEYFPCLRGEGTDI